MAKKIKPRGQGWVYDYTYDELRDLYRQEILINRNKLEMASLSQATIFEKWHSASEEVEADISDEERRKGRYISKLELKVRDLHPRWKEGHYKAYINRSEKLEVINKRLSIMKRYRSTLKGAVEACRQRKAMIQTLKDLYMSSYWSKTTPGGTPYGKEAGKIRTKKRMK